MASAYREPMMLIDGEWTRGGGRGANIINPATEEVLGTVPHATIADLDRALEAAARGFAVWSAMSAERRCDILMQAARLMRERAEAMAPIVTMEHGKPVGEAIAEVARAAGFTISRIAPADDPPVQGPKVCPRNHLHRTRRPRIEGGFLVA
jgi:succinate-semialdehyde dehydrogenase / glutarate-semialdehyde dehydrogenase